MYAFAENYVLSLSHDEVVHGKYSLINKMPGDVWRKFASLRTLFMYQMSHPGAKLNFMGAEFGQFIEWRFYEQLEWFMLDYESHRLLQDYVSKLNRFYIDHGQLWKDDHTWAGFEWIAADDTVNNVFVYARKSPFNTVTTAFFMLFPFRPSCSSCPVQSAGAGRRSHD